MKFLLTTVLTLCLCTFVGCRETSDPATDRSSGSTSTTDLHGENDGHDHGKEAEKTEAAGEDHSGHDH